MKPFTRWTGYFGLGGLFLLGGLGAAQAVQQEGPPQLDVDQLVTALGLDNNAKAEITPQLEKLNQLLAERARVWDEHDAMRSGMSEIFSNVFPRLNVEQRQTLRQAVREAHQAAGWGRHMGGRMGRMLGSGMHLGQDRHCTGRQMPMEGAGWMRGMRGSGRSPTPPGM